MFTSAVSLLSSLSISLSLSLTILLSLSLSLLLKTQIFEVADRRPFEIKFVIGIIYPRGRRVHAPVYCQYIPCLPLNSLYLSFHHSSVP